MRFAVLGSGSAGNATLVECGGARLLIDAGFSCRELERRMHSLGVEPDTLGGVVLTHEHDDHVRGADRLARRWGVPVWATEGTLAECRGLSAEVYAAAGTLVSGTPAEVGGFLVEPFTVPHDAREPVQFVFSDGASRLGVLTDIGASTAHVEATLSGCDALVLECNHDLPLLWGGGYPKWLKERIAGPFGHLDNNASERLLGALDRSRLQHVVCAHLSEQNNRPDLARAALARALGCAPDWVGIATQDEGFGWRELR
jgi:phosphoribosyl 1,2-cyclic phosphodiesterase